MSKETVIDVLKSTSSSHIVVVSKTKKSNQAVKLLSKIIHIRNTEDLTSEDICNLSDNSDGLFAYRGKLETGTGNGLAICPGKGGLIQSYLDWAGQFPFRGANRRDDTTTLWVGQTGVVKPIYLSEPQKYDVCFKTSWVDDSDTFVAEGMAPIVRHNKPVWVWQGDTYKEGRSAEEVLLLKVPVDATPTQMLELSKHYRFITVGILGCGKPYLRLLVTYSKNEFCYSGSRSELLEVRLHTVDGVQQIKSLLTVDTRNINFNPYIDIEGEELEIVKSI
jgi:hypothetical protein